MDDKFSRRKFIKAGIGTIAAASLTKIGCSPAESNLITPTQTTQKMPTRQLGKTGYNVCLFSLGGQAVLEQTGNDSHTGNIINAAIDLGVNYIDTSNYYGGGISETYIGRVMKTRRKEVFLATKTLDRTYSGAMAQLDPSLTRLQTDKVDLW